MLTKLTGFTGSPSGTSRLSEKLNMKSIKKLTVVVLAVLSLSLLAYGSARPISIAAGNGYVYVACKDLKGKKMFSVAYRGFDSKVIYGCDQPVDENKEACQECDTCIALCPSGALLKPRKAGEERAERALYIRG